MEGSLVKQHEMKSLASAEIPSQMLVGSKANLPLFIFAIIPSFEKSLKGGIPESTINAITPIDQISQDYA